MRLHPIDAEHAKLVDYIRDYAEADIAPNWQGTIAETVIGHRINTAELAITMDSPAWSLTSEVFGRIPIKLSNAPVYLEVEFGDVTFPILNAATSLPIPSDNTDAGYQTQLLASTPGGMLDKISIGERLEYVSERPETIIRDAIYRNPLYDPGLVQIAEFNSPLITRVGSDGFEDEATLRNILEAVQEQVGCSYYDTPLGGFRCFKDPGFGEGSSVAWYYDANSSEVLLWNEPTWATPDEQYTEVIVRDPLPEGATGGMGPGNNYRIWVMRPVNYGWMDWPPVAGQTLWIPFDGTGTDAYTDARNIAAEEARKLSNGLFLGEVSVAFNPLLEPLDVLEFAETAEDDTGVYRRTWRAVIEELNHQYGEALVTNIVYRATLVNEERLPDPEIGLPGASPEIIAAVPFGVDELGEWVDPDQVYGAEWVGTEIIDGEEVDFFDSAMVPLLIGSEIIDGEEVDFIDF